MKLILFFVFAFLLVGVLTIYLVENNIIKFQSELDFEETQNIEQYILDWDTIVNDSKYAYDGSVRLQSEFFDLTVPQKAQSLKQQSVLISKTIPYIQGYLSIPEARYPNIGMYHQSLISRAGLLQEFSELIIQFHHQSNTNPLPL